MNINTPQRQTLLRAKACNEPIATILGLSFANRDLDLIEHLKTLHPLPVFAELPSAEVCQRALGVEQRWVELVFERVARFIHKASLKGDYSRAIALFYQRPEVRAIEGDCRQLRTGVSVFLGDSNMDSRHFGTDAPYSILVGGYLESIGVGPYVNAGIGGNTAAQGLARFDIDVVSHRPVRVVTGFGGNDLSAGFTIEQICAGMREIIQRSQATGADVIFQGIGPFQMDKLWWHDRPLTKTDLNVRYRLRDAERKLAEELNASYLNLMDFLGPEDYCIDGLHLNQAGHERCAIETLNAMTRQI